MICMVLCSASGQQTDQQCAYPVGETPVTGRVGGAVPQVCPTGLEDDGPTPLRFDDVETLEYRETHGGARAFAVESPLQGMWRAANIATRHALRATDLTLEIYGRALLDVEGRISPVV